MEFSLEVSFMIEGENIFLIVPRYGPQIPSLSMKSESKIVEETTRCLALAWISLKTRTDFTSNISLNLFENTNWFHPEQQPESLPKHGLIFYPEQQPESPKKTGLISPWTVARISSKNRIDFTPNNNLNLLQKLDWFHPKQ